MGADFTQEIFADPQTTSICTLDLSDYNGAKKLGLVCTLDDAELIAFGLFCANDKVTTIEARIEILSLAESILDSLVTLGQPKCDRRLKVCQKELARLRAIVTLNNNL